ncbi:MAG: tetratricopeptide repeat protein, partial [Bacteroidota bacterium]
MFCFTILCSVQLNAQNGTDATGVKKAIIDLAKKGDQKGVENEIRNLEIIITGHGAKRKIALELKDIANELNQNEHSEASILMSRKTISFATDHFGSNDTIVGIANDYIGNNYLQLGQADSALIYYDKATKVLKDNHVPAQYAFSLIGKTVSHYYLNEIMEMEKPLMEARDISYHKATDNEDLRGLCSQLSGVLYDAIGDYDKAIELNKEAISVNLSKPIPDSIILATDYNNLGAAYFTKGDFDLTNEYLEESLKISQKLNIVDEGTLRVLVNLIFSYSQKNDVQNTKKYLKLGEEMIMDYPFLKNQFSYISFLNAACYLHLDENDF